MNENKWAQAENLLINLMSCHNDTDCESQN